MTTKPIAVWICVRPNGVLIIETARESQRRSKYAASDFCGAFDWAPEWDELLSTGYQCKRFILSEAEGKR